MLYTVVGPKKKSLMFEIIFFQYAKKTKKKLLKNWKTEQFFFQIWKIKKHQIFFYNYIAIYERDNCEYNLVFFSYLEYTTVFVT